LGLGIAPLQEFLSRHRLIGADTMVFIYHLEDHPIYAQATEVIFESWEAGNTAGVTSIITLLEILVKPKRDGNLEAARDYREMLTRFPNLELVILDLELADRASGLRAKYNLKTPDAIQIAATLQAGGTAFITNDPAFKRVTEIEVLVMDELIAEEEKANNGSIVH
jgi:predicted nucleic acid-binding protein